MEMSGLGKREGSERPALFLLLIKCLLAAYLATGGCLLLLALLLYRFGLSESAVNIGIIAIYALSCFLAGLIMGKRIGEKRFLWGFLAGLLYFAVLAAVTLLASHGFQDVGNRFFTTLMICAASGMLGGMVS